MHLLSSIVKCKYFVVNVIRLVRKQLFFFFNIFLLLLIQKSFMMFSLILVSQQYFTNLKFKSNKILLVYVLNCFETKN